VLPDQAGGGLARHDAVAGVAPFQGGLAARQVQAAARLAAAVAIEAMVRQQGGDFFIEMLGVAGRRSGPSKGPDGHREKGRYTQKNQDPSTHW